MLHRLEWLIRKSKLERRLQYFKAHWTSYADKKCAFAGFNAIGPRTSISESTLGRFTYVSGGARIVRAQIGAFCSIGPDVLVGGLASHPTHLFSTHPAFYSSKRQANYAFVDGNHWLEQDSVILGNDVWIGARAMILDGCKVGDGAIIAAGAVVTKDVHPYAIVGGIPARVLKMRLSEEVATKVQNTRWWDLSIDELQTFARDMLEVSRAE